MLAHLPFPLALVVEEYLYEVGSYQALHRICSTLEVTCRFLTAVALAELIESRGIPPGQFPDHLRVELMQHLERPTLGSWKVLLSQTTNVLETENVQRIFPELTTVSRAIESAMGSAKHGPDEKLLAMRNLLAHSGRLSNERTEELLRLHADRFEGLIQQLSFLERASLLSLSPDGRVEDLTGLHCFPDTTTPDGVRASEIEVGERQVVLRRKDDNRSIPLRPLHMYGDVFRSGRDGLVPAGDRGYQIYNRLAETGGIELTVLGGKSSDSRGRAELREQFQRIFPIDSWRKQAQIRGAIAQYSFIDRIDSLLRVFLGRDAQVEAASRVLLGGGSGIWWLAGKPGMGKSAFMAAIAKNLSRPEFSDVIVLPYFFLASESNRCSAAAFSEAVLLRLMDAVQAHWPIESSPSRRIEQATRLLRAPCPAGVMTAENGQVMGPRRILLLADGVDEVHALDPGWLEMVVHSTGPAVTWLCASREDGDLPERFHQMKCRLLFERHSPEKALSVVREEEEGLLPPLRAADVRGYFVDELGHRLHAILDGDALDPTGQRYSNRFIDEVVARSQGLPLYLRMLVEDLRAGKTDCSLESALSLPKGLNEYYDRVVSELGDDVRATLPAVTALLSQAREPLPLRTLEALLRDHELVCQPDGHELLLQALEHGRVMLRRCRISESRSSSSDSSSEPGYDLYHHSLREHLQTSDRVRRTRSAAKARLCNLALSWRSFSESSPERCYALSFGVSHLAQELRFEDATRLLLDLEYLEARCRESGIDGLQSDFERVVAAVEGPEAPTSLLSSISRSIDLGSHVIRSSPELMFQQVYNQGSWHDRPSGPIFRTLENWRLQAEARGDRYCRSKMPPLCELHGPLQRTLEGHDSLITCLTLSQDGKRALSGSRDRTLKLWDLQSGHLRLTLLGHESAVLGCCFLAGGRQCFSTSEDGARKIWDLDTGLEISSIQDNSSIVLACAALPREDRVLLGTATGGLELWSATRGPLSRVVKAHDAAVTCCSVSSDGCVALTGAADGTLKVWDLKTWSCTRVLAGHAAPLFACAFNSDTSMAASASGDYTVKTWRLSDGAELYQLVGHRDFATACAFTPDGRALVSTSADKTVKSWDLSTGKCCGTLLGHSVWVSTVALSPDGTRIVTGSWDKSIKVWSAAQVAEPTSTSPHSRWIKDFALDPTNGCLASYSWDGTIALWNPESGELLRSIRAHAGVVSRCEFIPGSSLLLSAGHDRLLKLWDVKTGLEVCRLAGHRGQVTHCAVSHQGDRIVSTSMDGTWRVWSADSATELIRVARPGAEIRWCALSSSGEELLSVDCDGSIHRWSLQSGELLQTLRPRGSALTCLLYENERARLLTTSIDRVLEVWDLTMGCRTRQWVPHETVVTSLSLESTGERLLSGAADGTLRLWDMSNGALLKEMIHEGATHSCHLLRNGKWAVSTSLDRTLRLWDLESSACLARFVSEAPLGACKVVAPTPVVAAGDRVGNVRIIEFAGCESLPVNA